MVGSSNLGYFVYFVSTLVATCEEWLCWSNVCGFILMGMFPIVAINRYIASISVSECLLVSTDGFIDEISAAYPKILFLAAFLLLLSFWVDLCHQTNDEEDDDDETNIQQALLENLKSTVRSSNTDGHRRCCSFRGIQIGSRQKFVIVVAVLAFVLMMSFAVIIWIGLGQNPIDSAVAARVYEDFLAAVFLSLGGGLGCYGLMLFFKLKKVRSEQALSEMWKVAGLAVVSVVCFTASTSVALLTDIPLFYHWHLKKVNGAKTLIFLILYYFIGFSVPSAFVLWIMRELPPPLKVHKPEQPRAVTFIGHGAGDPHPPRRWASVTSSNNQASKASPV